MRRENAAAADGTRLALYRVGRDGDPPVVLMPGTFSNHSFWLGTRGCGLAWYLAESGLQAVVLDPRGHGGSERADGRDWSFEDWGRLDVPAAVVAASGNGRPVFLVGHSAGGASMLIGLAGEPSLRERVAGVVVLGTPVPWLQRWRGIGAHAIRAATRLLGRFPARRLGLGPEDELPGVMAQWMTWNLRREWRGRDGTNYVERLGEIATPVLGMSGAGDTVYAPPHACRALVDMVGTPDASYVLAGRRTGFSEDFDHSGIVVSRAARVEVWPRIVAWLQARCPASAGGLPGA